MLSVAVYFTNIRNYVECLIQIRKNKQEQFSQTKKLYVLVYFIATLALLVVFRLHINTQSDPASQTEL